MSNIAIMYDNNVVHYGTMISRTTMIIDAYLFVIVCGWGTFMIYAVIQAVRISRHTENRKGLLAWVQHTKNPNITKADKSKSYANANITLYPNYRILSIYLLLSYCCYMLPYIILNSLTASRYSPSLISVASQHLGIVMIIVAIVILCFIGTLLLHSLRYRHNLVCTKEAISLKRPGKTQSILWNETVLCTKRSEPILGIKSLSYDLYEISDNTNTISFDHIPPHIMKFSSFAIKVPIQEYEQEIQKIISYITKEDRCPVYDLDKTQFAYPDLNEVRNKPHPIAQQRKRRRAVDRIQEKEYLIPSQNDDI